MPESLRAAQTRHDLLTRLTIIQSETQLLQRRVRGTSELSDGHRQQLERGLVAILEATQTLCGAIDGLPGRCGGKSGIDFAC